MTEQQILTKLTAVCSRAEHCKEDMRRKMERWEVADDMQEKVIDYAEDLSKIPEYQAAASPDIEKDPRI